MSSTTTLESQQQNLSALQRLDSKIFSVLGTSTHVTAYRFDESVKQWFRKDIEGSLFVVNTTEQPYCKLIVMNRLSTKNLVEEISDKIIIKCQGQYLIYKNRTGEINGIWFYEMADQEKIFNLLKEIQKQPPIPTPPPQQLQQQQPPQPQQLQPQPQQLQTSGTMSPGMIPPPGFIMPQNGMHHHPHQFMQPPQHVYPPYMMNQQPPQQQQQQQQTIQHQQPQTIHQQQFNNNNNNNINNPTPNKQQPPLNDNINNNTPITPNTIINQIQQNSNTSTTSSKTPNNSNTPQQLSPTIKKEVPLLSVLMNSVVIKENVVTKDQIRETLKRLVNDENFIDLVYSSYINE